jgi:hypothetical protein
MENIEIIEKFAPSKKDLNNFVNLFTLGLGGLTMLGYIIYMTWCIASFVNDIDKKLALQQLQIEQISQSLQDISNKLDR